MLAPSCFSVRPPYCPHAKMTTASPAKLLRFLFLLAALALAPRPALAQAPPQFVYVADTKAVLLYGFQLNTTTGALTAVPGSPFNERLAPSALAVNPAGTFLFVANGADNDVSVFQINTTTGALTEIANSPFATGLGTTPTVLTTDPTGTFLYVGNTASTGNLGEGLTTPGEIDSYFINPTTGELTPTPNSTPPNGLGEIAPFAPVGIFAHPNGLWLYVQGGSGIPCNGQTLTNNWVAGYVINPATGDLTSIGNFPTYSGPSFTLSLQADPAGTYLINIWGENCDTLDTLTISQADGTLTQTSEYLGAFLSNNAGCSQLMRSGAIDSTGSFLYTSIASFSETPAGVLTPDVVFTTGTIPFGPWVADPIGPFVFANDGSLHSYSINLQSGVLTEAPGSPYGSFEVSESFPPTNIAVTGAPPRTSAPTAVFLPASLTFTNTALGVPSAAQQTTLYNSGTATLNISEISISGANMADFMQTNTCQATLAAGSNCTFSVVFTPSVPTGGESAQINVTDNASGSPQSVSLNQPDPTPTPPVAVLNPTSLTFGDVGLNSTSAPQSLTVTNTGTQTLTISGVTLGGANPGDFGQSSNCVGANLAFNASCTVTIQFVPQAVGQRTATVNVTDNSNSGSPQMEMLTGTAVNAFNVTSTGPTSMTVTGDMPAVYNLNFAPAPYFLGTVSFSCTVAPGGPACNVSPSTMQAIGTANPSSTPVKVTATMVSPAAVRAGYSPGGFLPPGATSAPRGIALAASTMVALFGLALLVWLATPKPAMQFAGSLRTRLSGVAAIVVLGICYALAACGGSGGGSQSPPPQNFTVTMTATAGQVSQSVNLSLTIQQ